MYSRTIYTTHGTYAPSPTTSGEGVTIYDLRGRAARHNVSGHRKEIRSRTADPSDWSSLGTTAEPSASRGVLGVGCAGSGFAWIL